MTIIIGEEAELSSARGSDDHRNRSNKKDLSSDAKERTALT